MLILYKDRIIQRLKSEYPLTDPNLIQMILFGSVARDDFSPNSDMDLLLITKNKNQTKEIFSEFRGELLAEYAVIILALYATEEECNDAIEPIYSVIKKEGIPLWKK